MGTQIANPACPASNATTIRRSLAALATESVVMTTAWCQSSRRSGKVVTVGKGVALTNATCAWATVTPTKIANPACPASVAWALRRSLDALATEHAMLWLLHCVSTSRAAWVPAREDRFPEQHRLERVRVAA